MSSPLPGSERLRRALDTLASGLLERETAVRLVLLSALAGEHTLLIGPPGTAKSELARRLHRCFAEAPYFERLLTRFSTPEELFGPLSLKALEDDRYERLVAGFLPTAGIAFLDEVFKANSAILNALLTLLNEREFDNGSGRQRTPLISVVAASNEVPVDEALQAFHDRFLVRVGVEPVGDAAFGALLQLPAAGPGAPPQPITAAQRQACLQAAAAVTVSRAAIEACTALRGWLASRQLALSDRRWRQWIALMKVAAATEGRDHVDEIDLWLAPFVASPRPELAPALAEWFRRDCLGAVAQDAPWLTRAVEAFETQLEVERHAGADEADDAAGKLAVARAVAGTATDAAMPRIVASALEDRLRRRYSSAHVEARVGQLDGLIAQGTQRRADVAAVRERLAQRTGPRLWLPPAQVASWLQAHDRTLAVLDALLARLTVARQGFAALPVDDRLQEAAAPPLAWAADGAAGDDTSACSR